VNKALGSKFAYSEENTIINGNENGETPISRSDDYDSKPFIQTSYFPNMMNVQNE